MKIETERKFLVSGEEWRPLGTHSSEITQGYFPTQGGSSVRIRVIGDRANINIKGKPSGCSRVEFEYEIPVEDAWMMLEKFCGGTTVRKTRFFVPAGDTGLVWEIDEYHGPFEGHATAEVELPEEDHPFPRPEWLGKEVTDDHRFSNLALALAQSWPGA